MAMNYFNENFVYFYIEKLFMTHSNKAPACSLNVLTFRAYRFVQSLISSKRYRGNSCELFLLDEKI